MIGKSVRYREVGPCPPGACYRMGIWGREPQPPCGDECFAARYLLARAVADVEAPELFGESPVSEPNKPGDDIEPAPGERWFCGGCGAEHWEHEDEDAEPCCDWTPWEDHTWD